MSALTYAIEFVADMDRAVAFYTRALGLKLRFASPEWSELDTGSTTLALHKVGPGHAPGSHQLGFRVDDVDAFCAARAAEGVTITQPPEDLHGRRMARLRGPDGAEFSVSGP